MLMQNSKVGHLLRPQSVAILGASDRDGAFGRRIVSAVSGGFTGKVYPINPKYAQIGGHDCFAALADLPETPDCVLLALGDNSIVSALEQVAERGIPSAVIFGRAYGEHSDGRQRTEALQDIAREAGIALAGANCMGYINWVDRLQVTGMPFDTLAPAGHVSLISHSGSTWSGLVGNQRGIRFNYGVSAGQELVTTAADYLKFFLQDRSTRVVAAVLETVRDPEGFLEALEQADSQDVPVVVLKLGRSDAGKNFALSHTGALSGSNAAYDAIFERHNVIAVRSLDELTDVVELFQQPRRATAPQIGVGTDSGGERQLIVDLASEIGVGFATLSQATNAELESYLDPGVEASNPVDYWGDGGDVMEPCLSALAKDPAVGMVVMAQNMVGGRGPLDGAVRTLETVLSKTDKPVALMGNIGSTMSQPEVRVLRDSGVAILMGTENGLKGIKHFLAYQFRQRRAPRPSVQPSTALQAKWIARIGGSGKTAFSSAEGFELLADYGIPTAAWAAISSPTDLDGFTAAHGYPVVLKIDDPLIAHKSEVGGVIVGPRDREQAQAALQTLNSRHPGAPVIVQSMAKGAELLLGMTSDPQFGPVITLGMGGIFVEILRDAVSMVPLFSPQDVQAALERLACYPILKGARGQAGADLEQTAQIIARFGTMCAELKSVISEIEVNPLMLGSQSVAAVDCLIVPFNESE